MKFILLLGTIIVNLALVFYTVSFIKQKKQKAISGSIMRFQLIGLIFDVVATVLMISGSSNSPFSLHGILGYSSLTGMLLDTYLLFKLKANSSEPVTINKGLSIYSNIAYIWWIAAFITGALLVMIKRF
jgi:hypothetical protein